MKKSGILNSSISKTLSDMGHTDKICICDVGLPIPGGMNKIDLALRDGFPSFIDVLKEVVSDMHVEKIYLAEEIKEANKVVLEEVKKILANVEIIFVSHSKFKEISINAKGIIRTGEITPYANIILESAVYF